MFDGHGGETSAAWLYDHLFDDILQHIDTQLLQPDPDAAPIPGRPGVTRSTRAELFMTSVFQQADEELIEYLIGKTSTTIVSGYSETASIDEAWLAADSRACL